MIKKYIIALLFLISFTQSLDNGLGRTPQMGWNSWNHYGCNVNQTIIQNTAQAMVSSGLAEKGYIYVNIDDCWQIARNNQTGQIIADPTTFPSGIPSLAQYVHNLGLKFGLYSDAGNFTCQHRPGSLGYETIDAQTYASWNVDYLKYDNCYNDDIPPKQRYPIMRDALNATGHEIFYSLCEWGQDEVWKWGSEVGNSWRDTGDIQDNWKSFLSILDQQVGKESYAGPGGWNDPDMLEVGNGGMTTNEYQAHFAFWCLLKAPLIIGCDVTNMSNDTLTILGNSEVIAINQDPLGVEGKRVRVDSLVFSRSEIWAGPIQGSCTVVIVFNRDGTARSIKFTFKEVSFVGKAQIRDIINHKDLGNFSKEYSVIVQNHSVAMLKLCPIQNFEEV